MNIHELQESCTPKTGWLGRAFASVSNPRRWRWRRYLAACRAIPKGTPCHGTTSWKKINARRCYLIEKEIAAHSRKLKRLGLPWSADKKEYRSPESEALSRVAHEMHGGLVASNLVMGRVLRRLKAMYPEEKSRKS